MKRRVLFCGFVAFALLCTPCKKSVETLSLLVWEGYADRPGSRRQTGCPRTRHQSSSAHRGLNRAERRRPA
jgi:hypothetical protein